MFISCGQDEPLRSPQMAYFSCVIGIYFVSFFYDHPVVEIWWRPNLKKCIAISNYYRKNILTTYHIPCIVRKDRNSQYPSVSLKHIFCFLSCLSQFYVIDNDNYLIFLLLTTSLNYKIKTNVHKVCKDSLRISVKRREDIVTICSTYYLATTEQEQYK